MPRTVNARTTRTAAPGRAPAALPVPPEASPSKRGGPSEVCPALLTPRLLLAAFLVVALIAAAAFVRGFNHRGVRGAPDADDAATAAAAALPFPAAPPSPKLAPPPPAPPNVCDTATIYKGITTEPLLLHTVAVNGGSAPFSILLPGAAASPGISPWESHSDIYEAMDRTETMMTAAYERILLHTGLSAATSVVVEVGVHEGWFATVAHHYGGYKVVAFDMQPLCALLARCTAAVNGALNHVIFNSYIGHGDTPLIVGNGVCGGGLGVGWKPDGDTTTKVPPTNLGAFFSDAIRLAAYSIPQPLDIALIKTDTEGYEPFVLETALAILPRVRNILLELFPVNWARNSIPEERGYAIFECLFAAGMEAVDLPRKDIDFQTAGEINLAPGALPASRIHAEWKDFRALITDAKNGVKGLTNPNIWLRWTAKGEAARAQLDLAALPACKLSLTHAAN